MRGSRSLSGGIDRVPAPRPRRSLFNIRLVFNNKSRLKHFVCYTERNSVAIWTRSVVRVSRFFVRLVNHQTAPFLTVQSLSSPESNSAAVRPSVGWCPTTSTAEVLLLSGQPVAARRVAALLSVPSRWSVSNGSCRAFAVCWQRVAGLTRMRMFFGAWAFSHSAISAACFSPLAVSLRLMSGTPSSASAWRQSRRSMQAYPSLRWRVSVVTDRTRAVFRRWGCRSCGLAP